MYIYIHTFDYGDIFYDKPNNENFQNKLEKLQYRACFTITGAMQGISRAKKLVQFLLIFGFLLFKFSFKISINLY